MMIDNLLKRVIGYFEKKEPYLIIYNYDIIFWNWKLFTMNIKKSILQGKHLLS